MARVTVEDCVIIVPNRFELCLIANNRAKRILSGESTIFDRREKPTVIALREISEKKIDIEKVRRNIVRNIKNQEIVSYEDLLANNENNEIADIDAEISDQNPAISKDSHFLEDNINVED